MSMYVFLSGAEVTSQLIVVHYPSWISREQGQHVERQQLRKTWEESGGKRLCDDGLHDILGPCGEGCFVTRLLQLWLNGEGLKVCCDRSIDYHENSVSYHPSTEMRILPPTLVTLCPTMLMLLRTLSYWKWSCGTLVSHSACD